MFEQQRPDGDLDPAYEVLTNEVPRRGHRRTTWLTVAAAGILAATAFTVTHHGGHRTQPASAPAPSVTVVGPTGALILVGADGRRRLMPNVKLTAPIALSPDGRKVAYVGIGAGGDEGLWVADSDGSNAGQLPLCRRCVPGWGLDWSHDGTRLAFMTSRPGEPTWQIRVRILATGSELEFERRGVLSDVAFSADDDRLAFVVVGSHRPVVATMDIGQGLSSLHTVSPPHRAIQTPAWSADGTAIYYTASDAKPYARWDGDSPLDLLRVSDVYALDLGTGRERSITHAATGERYYTVHRYGTRLLTIHSIHNGDTATGWLSPDGSSFEPLLDARGQLVAGASAEPLAGVDGTGR
ncbi:hypothetical protein GCM10009798_06600 [Nocardioides panacihumi]|uniref:Dipeptidylpeptidase IV N-terminal domain-containing protein n=1 Tax=Nocardioides panacihumi TaxID=400774 RepID=A0ABN2QDA4_9ACTN